MADADQQQRRDALRKKGQEFLERAVAQAGSRGDLRLDSGELRLNITKPAGGQAPMDPALETVGIVVEGLRLYIYALLFVVSSAASLVLAKATLTYMNTPAAAVFLHMLTAVVLLVVLKAIGELQLGPLSAQSLRACLPEVICSGLQVLCLFGLLYRESVYLVATWACLAPQVLHIASTTLSSGRRPRALQVVLLLCAAVLGGVALAWGVTAGPVSLFFLAAWALAELGHEVAAKLISRSGLPPPDPDPISDPPNKPTIVLYKNAAAALPVLVLGFLFNEGSALLSLELSVPTLTMLLLSCLAWGVASSSQLVVQMYTQPGFQLLLSSLSYIGILVAQVAIMGVGSVAMLFTAFCAVIVSIAMLWASAHQHA